MRKRLLLSGFTLSAALVVTSVSAQSSVQADAWLAWHGCWQAAGAPAGEALCAVPDGAGVRMLTVQGTTVVGEARVITDGQARQVEHDGCRGTELALWAVDRQRVFLRSDLTCEGGVTRRANGIFSFSSPTQWVSVQAITIGDRTATRTVRYSAVEPGQLPAAVTTALRASDPYARMAARRASLEAIDQNDVTEAVNSVDAVAAQEWLSETRQPFELADDREPAETMISGSALELTSRGAPSTVVTRTVYQPRDVVHIVERPVYVTTTRVHHVVRSCWDPFYAGWVSLGSGVRIGVNYNSGSCDRRYYGSYSPWGYDLYGWRLVPRPIVIVRGGPIVIHHSRYGQRGGYRSYERYETRPTARDNGDPRGNRGSSRTDWVPAPPPPSRREQSRESWPPAPPPPSRAAKSSAYSGPAPAPPSRVNRSSGDWTPTRSSKSAPPAAPARVNTSSSNSSSKPIPPAASVPRLAKPPK